MFRTAAIGAAFLVFAGIAGVALASEAGETERCGARGEILASIAGDDATRRAIGFPRGQGIVELWASEQSGAWLVLVTSPDGESCLAASGVDKAERTAEFSLAAF